MLSRALLHLTVAMATPNQERLKEDPELDKKKKKKGVSKSDSGTLYLTSSLFLPLLTRTVESF